VTTLTQLQERYGLVRKVDRDDTGYWELSHDGFVEAVRQSGKEAAAARP
jgi:hypothetical protein